MRILQIHNRYLYPGGEDASVDRIFHTLSRRHKVARCLFSSSQWTGADAPGRMQQAVRMFRNRESLEHIRELHDAFQPDLWLVHNIYPLISPPIFRLAGDLGVPVVFYCHNFRPFSVNAYCWAGKRIAPEGLRKNFLPEILAGGWQNSRLKTLVFALVLHRLHLSGWLKNIGAWIAISDFVRDRFVEGGIPASKVHALRHSWDLMNPLSPDPEDDGSFLFLGRLSVEKGVPVLLKTWRLLAEKLGEECPVLRICGEGPLEAEVSRQADRTPNIQFEGVVTGRRKADLLRSSRAVVIPSVWWEALGLVTYEAYDFGKPVLAARSGGLTETVRHGVTGLLHYPGDAGELAEQVLQMVRSPRLASEMGAAGRSWLEENTRVEDWLDAFDRIADGLSPQRKRPRKLALSLLCENPQKLTGLTSVFRELIRRSLRDDPDLEWVVFCGKNQSLDLGEDRVTLVTKFPANDRIVSRLIADHFFVGPAARRAGCDALVTVGFVPLRCPLPCAMHVLTLHHLDKRNQGRFLRTSYRRFILQHGLRKAKLVITNSRFAAGRIREEGPSVDSKLLVSPEGIDHALFHPAAAPDERREVEKVLGMEGRQGEAGARGLGYLLWISNLYPYKQADLLLEAYARLPETLRANHPLVFVGGNWENQREESQELARKLGIEASVVFAGWVPDSIVPALYRQAAAHVLASREETWGRSVTEAMACGCPCIVNRIPVMEEVAAGCALVVNFENTEEASGGLRRILTEETLRKELVRKGIQRAAELGFDRLTSERMERLRKF